MANGSDGDSGLHGSTVLINGAGTGIGESTAEEFASRGANLVLTARRKQLLDAVAERCRARGVEVLVRPLDVVDRAAAEACVAETVEHFGRLDVLAHIAGINVPRHSADEIPRRRVGETDPEDWDRVIDVNVHGVYNFVRAVIGRFRGFGGLNCRHGLGCGNSGNGLRRCLLCFEIRGHRLGAVDQPRGKIEWDPGLCDTGGRSRDPAGTNTSGPSQCRETGLMLRPGDVARAIVYVASQPRWVNIEQLTIRPTLDQEYPGAGQLLSRWKTAEPVGR